MTFWRILADDEVRAMAVAWDLFKSESSIEVRPQVSELHGFGMVPMKVVENEQTWKRKGHVPECQLGHP